MNLLDQLFAEAEATVKKQPPRAQMAPAVEVTPESEFIPEKVVALFNRVRCSNCQHTDHQFEGLFEVRKHIRKLESHWVRQTLLPGPGLPRSLTYRDVAIDFCPMCIDLPTYKEES